MAVAMSSRARPSCTSSSASASRLARACVSSAEPAGGTISSSGGSSRVSGRVSGQVAVGSQPTNAYSEAIDLRRKGRQVW